MKRHKQIRMGLLAALTLVPALPLAQANAATSAPTAQTSVQFQVGSQYYTDNSGKHALATAPYVNAGGLTMVPLRALAESLSAGVVWNPAKHTATVTGSPFGTVTISSFENKGGALFVPVRTIGSQMGAAVDWNNASHTVTLSRKNLGQTFRYDFSQGDDGWKGGFADLPVDYDPAIYELKYGRELLPLAGGANKTNYGLKLHGSNRSDDLFMFLTKKVEGLQPNTEYSGNFTFTLYTDEEGGGMGVGGAPAESVFVKAGITGTEPQAVKAGDPGAEFYRMNIDKGNQATEGTDAKIVGNVAKPDSSKPGYQPIKFAYHATAKTNANGELFLLIGTDSGYEGISTFYFDDVSLTVAKK